jgi:hypothetical protein
MAQPLTTFTTFRQGASQNVAYATSGGVSAASTAFGAQTYAIRVSAPGALSATVGVRYQVGDGTPTAVGTSSLLPVNWVEYITVTPGQKIAALSNDNVAGSLSVTELS